MAANLTPVHEPGEAGGNSLKEPTGADAYGTPRKASTEAILTSPVNKPLKVPKTD